MRAIAKKTGRDKAWVWICISLLLLLLTACDRGSPSGSTPATTPDTGKSAIPAPAGTGNLPALPQGIATADWSMYHRDLAHSGYVESMPDPHSLTRSWNTRLDGAVYAQPLIIGKRVIAATEGDSVYALDKQSGKIEWRTNVGTPVPRSQLPCGGIDPLGITGTPVYDPTSKLIFAVAEINGPAHILIGIEIETGQIKVKRVIDPPGMDPKAHQQRAALTLVNNRVYVAFGGLQGDCSDYRGLVVSSQTDGKGTLQTYQVPTSREGGIWASAGPLVDAARNIYVAVGNGEGTSGDWDHSDSVLRLSSSLQLQDGFAPRQWQDDNGRDADLGSLGPTLLPGKLIFQAGKSGLGYLLHADRLGGVGGQAQVKNICAAFGGTAVKGSSVYVPCSDGLRQVNIGPGATMQVGWHAMPSIAGSPVIGGNTVYSISGSTTLYALDSHTGAPRAQVAIDEVPHFATPALSGRQIFIGTTKGIIAITGA